MGEDKRKGLTKTQIMEILSKTGFYLSGNYFTKAHVNKNEEYYWANPNQKLLNSDWYLILDDDKDKVLYVFKIPERTLYPEMFAHRHDRPAELDIEIKYKDHTFCDLRSGICFEQFKIFETSYQNFVGPEEVPIPDELYTFEKSPSYRRPFSQVPDNIANMDIEYFEFLGIRYVASAWKNILITVIGFLYSKYTDHFAQFVNYNYYQFCGLSLSNHASYFFGEELAHEVAPLSGIFYSTNNSVKVIVRQIKDLMRHFDEDMDQIVVEYSQHTGTIHASRKKVEGESTHRGNRRTILYIKN